MSSFHLEEMGAEIQRKIVVNVIRVRCGSMIIRVARKGISLQSVDTDHSLVLHLQLTLDDARRSNTPFCFQI